jgi:hypothetical protein
LINNFERGVGRSIALGPDDTTQQARPPPKPDNERITRASFAALLPQYVSFPNARRNRRGIITHRNRVPPHNGKADENSGGLIEPFTSTVKQVLRVFNHNPQPVAFKVKTTAPKVCFVIQSLRGGCSMLLLAFAHLFGGLSTVVLREA